MAGVPPLDQLIRHARSGDPVALDALLRRSTPIVIRIVATEVHGRPDIDRDDLARRSLHYVYQQFDRYDPARAGWRTFVIALTRRIIHRSVTTPPDTGGGDHDPDRPDPGLVDGLDPRLRPVLGYDRLKHPWMVDATPSFLPTLEIIASLGGPPHKALSFFYSHLLFGRRKRDHAGSEKTRVPLWGDPNRVLDEVVDTRLDTLLRDFAWEILDTVAVEADDLCVALSGLAKRLSLPVRDVVAAQSRGPLKDILERTTGSTCVRDYLTGRSPAGTLAQWAIDVRRQTLAALGRPDRQPPELGRGPRTFDGPDDGQAPGRNSP